MIYGHANGECYCVSVRFFFVFRFRRSIRSLFNSFFLQQRAMTARGRFSQGQDWDPMSDDYNNSIYDAQYPDDDIGSGVQLDHTRLYITNIPPGLNDDGLRTVFCKFGVIKEAYVSKDATKRFALVRYETSSEAKLAMMKMNKTEPLKLVIAVAHKTKARTSIPDRYDNRDRSSWNQQNMNGAHERNRDDNASVGSRGKTDSVDVINDEIDKLSLGLGEALDSNWNLELECLKLQQLKLQEQQLACKHRMLLLKQAERKPAYAATGSGRRILPDGKIEVRNVNGRSKVLKSKNTDRAKAKRACLGNGRQCVQCGRSADAYCAGCGVTPYCSSDCQRRDWRERHKDVCHNLARFYPNSSNTLNSPRSPPRVNFVDQPDEQIGQDEKFMPPDHKPPNQARPKNFRPRSNFNNNQRRPQGDGSRRQDNDDQDQDEDWDNKKGAKKPFHTPKEPVKPQQNEPPKESVEPAKQSFEPAKKSFQPVKQSLEPAKKSFEPVKKSFEPVKQDSEPVKPNVEVKEVKQAPSVDEVTSVKKPPPALVPKSYLIETLSVGDVVLLSVDTPASQCRSPRSGYVCLSMHDKYETDYQKLCEDYVVDCETDNAEYSVTPGETFSYFNPEDSGWYRARCLTPALAALLDSSKVVSLTASDKCKKLIDQYSTAPEFCCVLDAKSVTVGQNLKCTIVSKTNDGYTLSMEDVESGVSVGTGDVARWLPEVEYPQPKTNAVQASPIPEVRRPQVRHGARVLLVEAGAAERVLVRPADADAQRRFDGIVQDVAVFGSSATVLKEAPVKGSTVVAKYTDGLHYRALVKRTNVKQNKYLLEYIEYGNVEIVPLENLYPCPQEMTITTVPTEVSVVKIALSHALTAKAQAYLEDLKDQELILTLPNSTPTAPSDSEATLTLAKNNECVNAKLQKMCKPEWKKIEEKGGDVVATKRLMFSDLQHLELPSAGCVVEVLDCSMLAGGVGEVAGCQKGLPHKEYVYSTLRQRITEYCNSEIGRQPYLPRPEELCIAKDSKSGTWHRAVLMEQESGAGGSSARVFYVDRGNTELLPVASLRKILPEFVNGLPAVAVELEISGFPAEPTAAMVSRALASLKRDNGLELRVRNCAKRESGLYAVEAPDLIDAILED
ncbi:hypothetical protein K1T71_000735 [Dendrolimus kikuchii]|uniref:Uncharacterized protein n=1 Tax=Dendrolimus kikuchii TaxID=765133 RepID=A0ACC1DL26_9NEOP|nr:hypothetical protein K1T71_000735 [Dendrolimus kikuchii]